MYACIYLFAYIIQYYFSINSCIPVHLNVIYVHFSLHASCTCPYHADIIFYCIQYFSRTGYPNTKYYRDKSFKLYIPQQLDTVLYKYSILGFFLTEVQI